MGQTNIQRNLRPTIAFNTASPAGKDERKISFDNKNDSPENPKFRETQPFMHEFKGLKDRGVNDSGQKEPNAGNTAKFRQTTGTNFIMNNIKIQTPSIDSGREGNLAIELRKIEEKPQCSVKEFPQSKVLRDNTPAAGDKGLTWDANTRDTNSVKNLGNQNHIAGKDRSRKELNSLLINKQSLLNHTVLSENLPDLTKYSEH
jgi:hypothetical protein